VHIDLRMTDISDFVNRIWTNEHLAASARFTEIITARNQLKPVLLISPPISYDFFPALHSLYGGAEEGAEVLRISKENAQGLPSQWYGNIVAGTACSTGFAWSTLISRAAISTRAA